MNRIKVVSPHLPLPLVHGICHRKLTGGNHMASKSKLKDAAVKIGSVVGKVDGTAHKAARKTSEAIKVARRELDDVTKQVEALKKQLAKSSKRLQDALR
jgi:septal ring factor EnvC (AmiA/AmiB activator)